MKCSKNTMLLYAVTNSKLESNEPLIKQCESALKGGITCLQLREKELDEESFLAEAIEINNLCKKYHVPFIINDNVNVAIKSGADGVHVGQSDMEVSEVRKLVGDNMIIGVSAHTVEEAKLAEAGGADYLGVGAIYATTTKTDATYVPLDELKKICKSVKIPVVAIGGMDKNTISKLSGTGVDGVAMVSAIFAADNIEQECRKLLRLSKDMVFDMER